MVRIVSNPEQFGLFEPQFSLIAVDDASDPSLAAKNAERLVNHEVRKIGRKCDAMEQEGQRQGLCMWHLV